MLKYCYFGTDNGNIKATLAMCNNRLPYACLTIANVTRHTLSASSLVSDCSAMHIYEEVILNDITKTISSVTNLVTYFKKSCLSIQLKQ